MADLNQYELSRVLGSRMQPIKSGRFGNFALQQTASEVLRARDNLRSRFAEDWKLGYEDDRVIVQAFEGIRNGASTDSLLWDRTLLDRFVTRSRELGLDVPVRLLNRRLINVRKNKARYARRGIVLSPTTRKEPKPSILPRSAPIVEFALVSLRYRYGVSIDDILLDPELSSEYERIAGEIAPDLNPEDMRRAALYIRKSRYIKKPDERQTLGLDIRLIEERFSTPASLSSIDPSDIPTDPGVVEVDEDGRHLYVVNIESIRPLVSELVSGSVFRIVENTFWKPDASLITMKYVCGKEVAGIKSQLWENRLIHDLDPVFNWPMQKKAA